MPITVSDTWNGCRLKLETDSGQISCEYVIEGTDDEFAAQTALSSATASTLAGYVKQSSEIIERLSTDAWLGLVVWGKFEPKTAGGSSFNFDTGGGSSHISQSLATSSFVASGTAPDFKGAIGVSDSGVGGVDIQIPVYNFSETHWMDTATVTTAYKATIYALTGNVNSSLYKGFAAGELLFKGASGSLRQHDLWEITFNFAASPNVTGLSVGDISGINKAGWDYLWVRYRKKEDTMAKAMISEPQAVYVERVYNWSDLSLLGI